jgi:hypothetical protein
MTRVTGPEPGYVATPIIFVELGAWVCLLFLRLCLCLFVNLTYTLLSQRTARCLLEQRAALPPQIQGGVFTPGAVFYSDPTRLIERLRAAGVDFAVVQQR